jgi:hypothetical protein
METYAATLDDYVDIVLHKIALSPTLTLSLPELYDVNVMNESAYRLDHFMIEKGLIKIVKEGRAITGKGLEIANFGGWIAYQLQLKKDKSRNVYPSDETRKFQKELAHLRLEIEQHKAELTLLQKKEADSAAVIRNLIEQNRNSKVLFFIGGIVLGVLCSSLLWYFVFG